MKFYIQAFFSKCDQIRRKLWIWLHLLKKSLMKNFIFCAVNVSFLVKSNLHDWAFISFETFVCISFRKIAKFVKTSAFKVDKKKTYVPNIKMN